MYTKYNLVYCKALEGTKWKHLVAIGFASDNNPTAAVVSTDEQDDYLNHQKKFLNFLTVQYGSEDDRWNVRWSDYGADVRFSNNSDASSFVMCFTKKNRGYYKTDNYVGIRGH